MAKLSLPSRLKRFLLKSRWTRRHHARSHSAQGRRTQGFTLIELLVVTAIAGGIVSGLTFIVVQMMTADQREASRSETQREMQLALDYIAAELREAIYVYPGEYLQNANGQPFSNYLPASVSRDSVPVLAFWKQHPFPQKIKNDCVGAPITNVSCQSGQSYALVVYSLTRNTRAAGSPWKGDARITRYVLSQFNSQGAANPGYVNPGVEDNFATWPFGLDKDGARVNLQGGRPTGQAYTLVDYVSLNSTRATQNGETGFCPDLPTPAGGTDTVEYSLSPPKTLTTGDFAKDRSFYACVFAPVTRDTRTGITTPAVGQYRDVIVFLRGSAAGRPGVGRSFTGRDQEILPTLQTRVLNRSILRRQPVDD
jgi:prepilin-type N-terminal cleavage/methylation domain-containing protein